MNADTFFGGLYETAVGPGEVLESVEVPKIAAGWKSGFQEFVRRHGDYAIIGLAAHVEVEGGRFGGGRLVFFGAGDRPVSAVRTAALLEGGAWSDALAGKLAETLKEELDPFEDLNADGAMRKHLAGVLVKRTLGPLAAG